MTAAKASPPTVSSPPYTANQGVPITFLAPATDPDNDIDKIFWSLDNDDLFNDANDVPRAFSQAGTFNVLVRANDTNGLIDTVPVQVTILDVTPPTAAITYSTPGPYKSGNIVTITATFNEPVKDSPIPRILISGANTLASTDMTKTSSSLHLLSYHICR